MYQIGSALVALCIRFVTFSWRMLTCTYRRRPRKDDSSGGGIHCAKDSVTFTDRDQIFHPFYSILMIVPLLMSVFREDGMGEIIGGCVKMSQDSLEILRRKEMKQIVTQVGTTRIQHQNNISRTSFVRTALVSFTHAYSSICLFGLFLWPPQSLALLSSTPVTNLMSHASSCILSCLHLLQSPSASRVTSHIEECVQSLIEGRTMSQRETIHAETQPTSGSQSRTCLIQSEQVGLDEWVQIFSLVESLASHHSAFTNSSHLFGSSTPNLCSTHCQQIIFSSAEARSVRQLVAQKDVRLAIIYRSLNLSKLNQGSRLNVSNPLTDAGSLSTMPSSSILYSSALSSNSSSSPPSPRSRPPSRPSMYIRPRRYQPPTVSDFRPSIEPIAARSSSLSLCDRHRFILAAYGPFVEYVRELINEWGHLSSVSAASTLSTLHFELRFSFFDYLLS